MYDCRDSYTTCRRGRRGEEPGVDGSAGAGEGVGRDGAYLVTAGKHSWLKNEAEAYKPTPMVAVLDAFPTPIGSDIS